jgi:hypothetical protein
VLKQLKQRATGVPTATPRQACEFRIVDEKNPPKCAAFGSVYLYLLRPAISKLGDALRWHPLRDLQDCVTLNEPHAGLRQQKQKMELVLDSDREGGI